jgi:hypothetical protein
MIAIRISDATSKREGELTAHDGMAKATESHWLCAKVKVDFTAMKARLKESFILNFQRKERLSE